MLPASALESEIDNLLCFRFFRLYDYVLYVFNIENDPIAIETSVYC